MRPPKRADVAVVRDVMRRGVCVVALRDFIADPRVDILVIVAPRGATDTVGVFVRETTFAPDRVDTARDAVRESFVTTAVRSRPDVGAARVPMVVCAFCDDVMAFVPRMGDVFEMFVAVVRDAARTISSYSKKQSKNFHPFQTQVSKFIIFRASRKCANNTKFWCG